MLIDARHYALCTVHISIYVIALCSARNARVRLSTFNRLPGYMHLHTALSFTYLSLAYLFVIALYIDKRKAFVILCGVVLCTVSSTVP